MKQQTISKQRSRTGIGATDKIRIAKDGGNPLNNSSCFNSMNYLSNLCYHIESRNQSCVKVKKSANSISHINTTGHNSRATSKTKKSSDLKIKSVSRSFSRRRHQAEKSVTAETGSHNTSYIGFNPKLQRGGAMGALYTKIKNKEVSYFGIKPSGRKTAAEKTAGEPTAAKEVNHKKEVMILNAVYNRKDYPALISTACAMVKEDRQLLDDANVRFLIAMSYYKMESFELAKLHFEELIKLKEKYKKSIFVFLAICLNNMKMLKEAENVLERACLLYPKYYEAKVHII